ncbi:O-antigen ligase family protein [Aestuariivivens sediminicola]|uniref:O-antigen ligase family protein n=1 Tax=Aestuariivivens sediminicola TaxID=2913560 RepID=UPI001F56F27B|nr:O-antigen ligase family protein [Aestuariivivens sediminicola]
MILILIELVSFTFSYAVSNIALYAMLGLFFMDKPARIRGKVKRLYTDRLVSIYSIFFLVQCIGLIYSENSAMGFRRLEVMLPLLFVPLVLSAEPLEKLHLNKIFTALKFLIPSSYALLLLYHLFVLDKALNTFVNFTITEKIGISQFYLAFILVLPLIECIRQIQDNRQLFLNGSLLMFNLGLVYLLGNKTTLVFLLFFGVIMMIQSFRKNRRTGLFMGVMLLVAIGFATQTPIVKGRTNVFLKTTDFNLSTIVTKNKYTITKNTVEHRLLIDYIAVQAIIKALPFGYGTGDYMEELYKGYKRLKFKAGMYYKYNTHNQYLEEFLKTGILGGLVFILLIIQLLKGINAKDPFTFIIVFFAFACCFESYLFRQHGVTILAFIVPLIIYNTKKLYS